MNSYIFYKDTVNEPISHFKFRECLVRNLAHLQTNQTFSPQYQAGGRLYSKGVNIEHRLSKSGSPRQCTYCSITQQGRNRSTRVCSSVMCHFVFEIGTAFSCGIVMNLKKKDRCGCLTLQKKPGEGQKGASSLRVKGKESVKSGSHRP